MEPQQPDASSRGSVLSLLLTFILGGGFLVFLILVSGGFFLWVALAVFATGSMGFLHYVLWGQSLMDEVSVQQTADDNDVRPWEDRGRGA